MGYMAKKRLIVTLLLCYFGLSIFSGYLIDVFNYEYNFFGIFLGPILIFKFGFGMSEIIGFFICSIVVLFFSIPYFIFRCGMTIFFFILSVFLWLSFGHMCLSI